MLHVQAPVLIKVRDGITVNIGVSVSQAIEKQLPQYKLKEGFDKDKRTPTQADYDVTGHADTVTFWFTGGTSLSYRVGHEITQEDFDRIQSQIEHLNFRTINDRVTSSNKTDK